MTTKRASYIAQGLLWFVVMVLLVDRYTDTLRFCYLGMAMGCLMVAIANFKVCYDERNKQ